MSVTNTELSKELQEKLDSFLKDVAEQNLHDSTATTSFTARTTKLKQSIIDFLTKMGESINELMEALALEENINISTHFTEADAKRLSHFMSLVISIIFQPMNGKSTTKINALLGAFSPLAEPWEKYIQQQNCSNTTTSFNPPFTSTDTKPNSSTMRRKSNSSIKATSLGAIAEVPNQAAKNNTMLAQKKVTGTQGKEEIEAQLLESAEALDEQRVLNQKQNQNIKEFERAIKILQLEIQSVKDDLKSTENKYYVLQEENQTLQRTIHKSDIKNDRNIEELKEKLLAKEKILEELVSLHKREINSKELELTKVVQKLDDQAHECLELEGENTILKANNTKLHQQIETLLKAAKVYKSEKEIHKKTMQSLQTKLDHVVEMHQKSEDDRSKLERELENLTRLFNEQTSELDTAKHTIFQLSKNPVMDPKGVSNNYSISNDLSDADNTSVLTSLSPQPLPQTQTLTQSSSSSTNNSRFATIMAILAEISAMPILNPHVNSTASTVNNFSSSTSSPTMLLSFDAGRRASSGTSDGTSITNSASRIQGNTPFKDIVYTHRQ